MIKLFDRFLQGLGSPKDQKSEAVALVVVYSMTLSFTLVIVAVTTMFISQFQPGGHPPTEIPKVEETLNQFRSD